METIIMALWIAFGAGVVDVASRGGASVAAQHVFPRVGLPYDAAYCPPSRGDCIVRRLKAEGKWNPS